MNQIVPRGNSIAAAQLSEIIMNCQNSHMMMISEADQDQQQRFLEREAKLKRQGHYMMRSSSQVLINADIQLSHQVIQI